VFIPAGRPRLTTGGQAFANGLRVTVRRGSRAHPGGQAPPNGRRAGLRERTQGDTRGAGETPALPVPAAAPNAPPHAPLPPLAPAVPSCLSESAVGGLWRAQLSTLHSPLSPVHGVVGAVGAVVVAVHAAVVAAGLDGGAAARPGRPLLLERIRRRRTLADSGGLPPFSLSRPFLSRDP
jgi:hypothetical protein